MSRCSFRFFLLRRLGSCTDSSSRSRRPQNQLSHSRLRRNPRLDPTQRRPHFRRDSELSDGRGSAQKVEPLTVKQKFGLFAKETFDPFTFAPRPPERRSRRSTTTIRSMDTARSLCRALWRGGGRRHDAKLFFRRRARIPAARRSALFPQGAGVRRLVSRGLRIEPRGGHAHGRGKEADSTYSGMLGMGMGIALSNAYYPDSSVSAEEVGHPLWNQPVGQRAQQSFAGILAGRS